MTTYALERTHLAKHDLDWLPPSYRAVRWGVAGAVWTGIFGAVAALLAFTKFQAIVYGKGLAALAAGGYFAGDRAARAALRGRLRKLAEGAVDLSRLPAEPDGELIHVVGRIRARQTLPSVLAQERVVWRRVAFTLGETRLIHEAAVDFQLVADGSEPVIVEVGQARLLASDAKGQWYADDSLEAEFLEHLPLPSELQRTMQRRAQQRARTQAAAHARGRALSSRRRPRGGAGLQVAGDRSDGDDAPRAGDAVPRHATRRPGLAAPHRAADVAPTRPSPPSPGSSGPAARSPVWAESRS